MKCTLKHRQRTASPSSDPGPMERNHGSHWLETAMERSKSCAQMDNSNSHFNTSQGLAQQPQWSMQARTEELAARWNWDPLKQEALSTAPRNWSAESVRHSLSSMNGNRASGVDGWILGENQRRGFSGQAKRIWRKADHTRWILVRNVLGCLPKGSTLFG